MPVSTAFSIVSGSQPSMYIVAVSLPKPFSPPVYVTSGGTVTVIFSAVTLSSIILLIVLTIRSSGLFISI